MKRALVIGGSGGLGRSVVEVFKSNWSVTSIDFSENSSATTNILLSPSKSFSAYANTCRVNLTSKFDAIICVAGGFGMGPISDPEVFEQLDKMLSVNLYPAILAGHLACSFLNEEGLLVLTGAAAVFKDVTPGLLAYGLSKTATHSLALNLAKREGLPSNCTVATLLPDMIDTPGNRSAMPDADFSKWTNPNSVAGLVKMWAEGYNRPANGSFAHLKWENNQVIPEFL